MIRIFRVVFGKELISFLRSPGLVAIVIYALTVEVYIVGAGIQIQPRNVPVGYVDNTGGGLSLKILSSMHAPEFLPPKPFKSRKELSDAIYEKEIIVGLIFDSDFEKLYRQGKTATLNVLLDATAASQSFTTLSYLQHITAQFSKVKLPISVKSHKLFNQNADNHVFMALTEMLSVTTLLIVILTAVVFVREKEDGTWDIMLLMPVNPAVIILAKTLSQVFIIMCGVVLSLGFVLLGHFDIPVNGSFWLFMLLAFLYSFASAGIGMFVAAVSRNVMQVAQLSVLIMMPMIFLSGAWTPVHAMHPVLKFISLFSPLRYFIEGSESLFFRGTDAVDMLPYLGAVFLLGVLFFYFGFRKIGKLF